MRALFLMLRSVIPVLLISVLTGCFVESLHPLYDQAAPVTRDSSLVGTWQTEKGADDHPATLVIAQGNENRYDLNYSEAGTKTELRGARVQVGGQWYLDVWIESLDQFDKLPLAARMHLVPTHSFWRMSHDGDNLLLAGLDYERLGEGIKARTVSPEHTMLEDNFLLLTGSPAQLREFLAKYATDPENFRPPVVFRRQK